MKYVGLIVIWLFGLQTLGSLVQSNYHFTALLVFVLLIAVTAGVCSAPQNINRENKTEGGSDGQNTRS